MKQPFRVILVGVLNLFPIFYFSGAAALKKTTPFSLFFVENQGQLDPNTKFYLKGSSHSILFGKKEIVYASPHRQLRQYFVHGNKNPSLTAAKKLAGKVHYLVGKDERNWKQNIPTYEEVVYQNLYPGIDLAFSGSEGKLKSEFRVAPGEDYKKILIAYEGANSLTLSDSGDVIIKNASQELREEKPIIYQIIDGKKVFVEGNFVVSRNRYGFKVSDYNPKYSLIIDPAIVFSTYFGGESDDYARDIATDSSGNVYITGETPSPDFYTTPTAYQRTLGENDRNPGVGTIDAFVIKLGPRGSLIYSTFIGGGNTDRAFGIAVDASGNAFITGETSSDDFPTTPSAYQRTRSEAVGGSVEDAFVFKLNVSGSSLLYSTYLGGEGGTDRGYGIALDPSGNAYVAGGTSSFHFPTTASAYQTILGGIAPTEELVIASTDAFVTKLNASGSSLIYSTYVGGIGWDEAKRIAVDGRANAYVTGFTGGPDFPITPGAFQETYGGGWYDAFVFKLNVSGSSLLYSTYLGGYDVDEGSGIAVRGGKAFVVGSTTSPGDSFPTTDGALRETLGGSSDAFIVKLNGNGSALHYSTLLGGAGNEAGYGIAVNRFGNAYVTGFTDGDDFPVTSSAYQESLNGGTDVIVSILNSSGSSLVYSTYLGGEESGGEEVGWAIALGGSNNVFITGTTSSDTFPRVSSLRSYRGGVDPFVTKIQLLP